MADAALVRLGYRILTANNGEEALGIYSSAPDAVDAVLAIRPDVVVVAMSGFDEREAKSRFGSGIGGLIQEPFTAGQLGAMIGAVRRAGKAL
jgi:hypothetical protein